MKQHDHLKNQIYHVLTGNRYALSILDIRSDRGVNIDSNHYLVKIKCDNGYICRTPRREHKHSKKYYVGKLKEEYVKVNLISEIDK